MAALSLWDGGSGRADTDSSAHELNQAALALADIADVIQSQPILAFMRLGGDCITGVGHDIMARAGFVPGAVDIDEEPF